MSTLIPTVFVEVELSGHGSGWTSLTDDVVMEEGIQCRIGINGSQPTDMVASTGTLSFTLRNDAGCSGGVRGYYSIYNVNRRSGWDLGIGCRLRLTDPTTATTSTRFVGRIDVIDPLPGRFLSRRVRVTAVDWMDEAARWALTPDIGQQVGKTWDQIVTSILTEMPRQPAATSFDVGMEAYVYALDTSLDGRTSVLGEFGKLAASEFGLIYQKADGTLRLEGRHSRLLNTTSLFSFGSNQLIGIQVGSTRDDLLNHVIITDHPKSVDELPVTVVYFTSNVTVVPSGVTVTISGNYRDPVTGETIGATEIQPQIAGFDYSANTAENESGTNITSDFVIVVTAGANGVRFDITNNNAVTGYLVLNRLRARAIYDRGEQQFEAKDSSSISTYGEHVTTIDMPYQSNADVAQGAANYLLSKFKTAPNALVQSITCVGNTSPVLTQLLTRDISDRISVSETLTSQTALQDSFINGIDLNVLPSGYVQGMYTLAPANDPLSGLYWILGTSTLGTSTTPAPF